MVNGSNRPRGPRTSPELLRMIRQVRALRLTAEAFMVIRESRD